MTEVEKLKVKIYDLGQKAAKKEAEYNSLLEEIKNANITITSLEVINEKTKD